MWEKNPSSYRAKPRDNIIICTGLKTRGGLQLWGSLAAGILCDRKQKG